MAETNEVHVFFAVFDFGDDIHAVTRIMQMEPSEAWLKGAKDRVRPWAQRTHSRWTLTSGMEKSAAFEAQLDALLSRLEMRADAVRQCAARFTARIVAAIYFREVNPSLRLDPRSIARLAALALLLEFDLYCLGANDNDD
jgi:hypothetical protein